MALGVACTDSEAGSGTDSDASTGPAGEGAMTLAPGTSASGDDSSSSTGTNESSSGGGEVEPEFTCNDDGCSASCSATVEYPDPDGPGTCSCGVTTEPDSVLDCPLEIDSPCAGFGHACSVQAIRYGVPGEYEFEWTADKEGGGRIRYTVLGPNRVHARLHEWTYCCGYSNSSSSSRYFHPQSVRPPDDPGWDDCWDLGESWSELPGCLQPGGVLTGNDCEAPGAECAEPTPWPGPEEGCDASCPMAGDGVCDEQSGTGLCADGCDPLDCTEEEPPKG